MNKPLTVKDLLKLCQIEIAKGHGDCSIMISNDDEGNGYHYLWYSFTEARELEESLQYDLDDDIAPLDRTIILG